LFSGETRCSTLICILCLTAFWSVLANVSVH
jgi:hypothetical protein